MGHVHHSENTAFCAKTKLWTIISLTLVSGGIFFIRGDSKMLISLLSLGYSWKWVLNTCCSQVRQEHPCKSCSPTCNWGLLDIALRCSRWCTLPVSEHSTHTTITCVTQLKGQPKSSPWWAIRRVQKRHCCVLPFGIGLFTVSTAGISYILKSCAFGSASCFECKA